MFKKLTTIGAMVCLCLASIAQITYNANDFANAGDSFLLSTSNIIANGYNFDTSGAGIDWSFDTLSVNSQTYTQHVDPNSTGYYTNYLLGTPPTGISALSVVNGCLSTCIDGGGGLITCTNDCQTAWNALNDAVLSADTIDVQAFRLYDMYNMYAKTANTYEQQALGFSIDVPLVSGSVAIDYNNADVVYEFPMNFGNIDSSESDFNLDVDGQIWSHWQKRVNEIDGYGSVSTPYGTFANVIRLKSVITKSDVLYIGSDTINLSNTLPDTTIIYEWFDAAWGAPVLSVKSHLINGYQVFTKATFIDSLRCLSPTALYTYSPIPTYLDGNTDSAIVNFTNRSWNNNESYWNFDDNGSGMMNTSSNVHASHAYTSAGLYMAELIVCNNAPQCAATLCDTFAFPVIVIDTTVAYANFVYGPVFPCVDDTVSFYNLSANDTAWFWDFGDGDTSILENPTHPFDSAGIFNVMLIAMKGVSKDTTWHLVNIPNPVQIGFTISDTITDIGITFTDTSLFGDINTSYLWSFAGGQPSAFFSTAANPTITFEKEDSVTVCLYAWNSLGCVSSKCETFFVSNCIKAQFSTSGLTNNFCEGATIVFNDYSTTSLAATLNYQWYVDGAAYASVADTNGVFFGEASHDLMLIINNGFCSDTASKIIYIKTLASISTAGADVNICIGDSVTFNPVFDDGGQTSYTISWTPMTDFDDASIANATVYPTATTDYVFKLQFVLATCDGFGNIKDTVRVKVDSIPPTSYFIASIDGDTASFNNMTIDGLMYNWDFDDGSSSQDEQPSNVFAQDIDYTVCLIAQNMCGIDQYCDIVSMCVLPDASFTPYFNDLDVQFQHNDIGLTNIGWTFGDGGSSALTNPTYTYDTAGTYGVCLTAINTCGISVWCDSITLVCDVPVPYFNSFVNDLSVSFSGQAIGNVTDWFWSFGNGDNSTDQTPSYTYLSEGDYLVCLNTTNTCGSAINCDSLNIVCSAPIPLFDFVINSETATFSDLSIDADTWFWDFGDGSASFNQEPTNSYTGIGNYLVILTTTNECGATSYSDTVVIETVNIETMDNVVTMSVYPNPFKDRFNINYALQSEGVVDITLYDLAGQKIKTLATGIQSAGKHTKIVNMEGFATGNYILMLKMGQNTQKIQLVK